MASRSERVDQLSPVKRALLEVWSRPQVARSGMGLAAPLSRLFPVGPAPLAAKPFRSLVETGGAGDRGPATIFASCLVDRMLPEAGVTNTLPALTRMKPSELLSTACVMPSSIWKFCANVAMAPVTPSKTTTAGPPPTPVPTTMSSTASPVTSPAATCTPPVKLGS